MLSLYPHTNPQCTNKHLYWDKHTVSIGSYTVACHVRAVLLHFFDLQHSGKKKNLVSCPVSISPCLLKFFHNCQNRTCSYLSHCPIVHPWGNGARTFPGKHCRSGHLIQRNHIVSLIQKNRHIRRKSGAFSSLIWLA